MNIQLPKLEPWLQRRYQQLVEEHLQMSHHLAAGLRALPDTRSVLASTQAAWRFYQNEKTDLATLFMPLLAAAREGVAASCDSYALAVHDWSRRFYAHQRKTDRFTMTHAHDVGDELQSTLLLSDQTGAPLAPVAQNLRGEGATWSSYAIAPTSAGHLEELGQRMRWLNAQNFGRPLVHIVDREADSAFHLRAWQQESWLIRANDSPTVEYQGQRQKLKAVAERLAYQRSRQVTFRGQPAWQWVAETSVILKRKAKPKRWHNGKRVAPLPGEPLELRLVVSRVQNENGTLLAQWLLLSNLTAVPAERLALWYYWRWRIESFFKLLKQAGHHLEDWQQAAALAVAKRLTLASMACVLVWKIAHLEHPQSTEIQDFLVRLSGRLMKRSKPVTYPAL